MPPVSLTLVLRVMAGKHRVVLCKDVKEITDGCMVQLESWPMDLNSYFLTLINYKIWTALIFAS